MYVDDFKFPCTCQADLSMSFDSETLFIALSNVEILEIMLGMQNISFKKNVKHTPIQPSSVKLAKL